MLDLGTVNTTSTVSDQVRFQLPLTSSQPPATVKQVGKKKKIPPKDPAATIAFMVFCVMMNIGSLRELRAIFRVFGYN